MKRIMLFAAVITLMCSFSAFAGKIVYTIDPSLATPQPVTVVAHGNGETVIFFEVSEFAAGAVYTFQLDMKTKGDSVEYPVDAKMEVKGKKTYAPAFEPEDLTFNDGDTAVSTVVTLTLPEGNYDKTKKIKVKMKADAGKGNGVGAGSGVKMVLLKAASQAEFLDEVTIEIDEMTRAVDESAR